MYMVVMQNGYAIVNGSWYIEIVYNAFPKKIKSINS
jgi:hypothetical protein